MAWQGWVHGHVHDAGNDDGDQSQKATHNRQSAGLYEMHSVRRRRHQGRPKGPAPMTLAKQGRCTWQHVSGLALLAQPSFPPMALRRHTLVSPPPTFRDLSTVPLHQSHLKRCLPPPVLLPRALLASLTSSPSSPEQTPSHGPCPQATRSDVLNAMSLMASCTSPCSLLGAGWPILVLPPAHLGLDSRTRSAGHSRP